MKYEILSPNPFPVADLGGPRRQVAEDGLYFGPGRAVGGAWPEQDSLQGKAARKDLTIPCIIKFKQAIPAALRAAQLNHWQRHSRRPQHYRLARS